MIKAAIFDMDGTTVNSINSIAHFANAALKKYGLKPHGISDYKIMVGNGAKMLVRRMIEKSEGSEEDYENVLEEYNSTYDNNFLYLAEPYEGILDLLKWLNDNSVMCAIVSNKPHETAKKISDALFGEKLICYCIGGREGVALKPDSAMPYEAMNFMGVKKDECIYIGDTATDMLTAKNAGLFSIGVLWGFRDKNELSDAGADEIVSSAEEIKAVIRRLNNK